MKSTTPSPIGQGVGGQNGVAFFASQIVTKKPHMSTFFANMSQSVTLLDSQV